MKKFVALILLLSLALSLAACGTANQTVKDTADAGEPTVSDVTTIETEQNNETQENTSSDISFEDVKSFEDFVEKLDESGYETNITQNDDGSVSVELNQPSANDDTVKPAIPTVDKVVKPVKPEPAPEKEPEPTPSTPEREEEPEKEPEKEKEEPEEIPEDKEDKEEEVTTPSAPAKPEKEEVKKPTYTYTTGQKHTKVPYTERYLYSVLDEEKKAWYREIDRAVTNLEARANIYAELSENSNYYIYYLYMFDNPEHFYLGNQVTIYDCGESKDVLALCYSDGELCCRFGGKLKEINDELRAGIRAKKAVFEAEVERILSTIPADAPAVWKERLIYDRILMDSHYNLSAKWDGIAEDNWTAYGIMVNKYGVCESYSEAFQTLCLYAGINCTGVIGTAGGGHKWNCVQLDGEWYMCDITFDDPIGGEKGAAYHYYFNLTSAEMEEYHHDWSTSRWPVPECTATQYSYCNYFKN